jgi:hypothetical protein
MVEGTRLTVDAGGIRFAALAWGPADGPASARARSTS